MSSSTLFEIEYDEKKKKYIIVENWLRMLSNRGWLKGSVSESLKSAKVTEMDTCHIEGYALKFLLRKITTVRKVDDIDEFFESNRDKYKFFVVSQMQGKAIKQLLENENVEVFNDEELMENIIDNILVPTHIVLSDEETEKYLEEYHVKKNELARIFTTDPIAKYYNIKPGQVVKIIRPSIPSGEEIAFRVCVPGQII